MSELHVICEIGGNSYAIPASEILQMESYSKITPVPGAAPYVSGLIQLRQQVIPIIDSRLRFGLPPAEPTPDSRFVILKSGKRLVGLLVDSAREIRSFLPEEFHSPPEMTANQTHGFVRAVAQIKDRIIMLIDSFRVLGEEAPRG